jgi:hypothetical protein
VDGREHYSFGIPQRERVPFLERVRQLLRHVERNRNGPKRAVREAHLLEDPFVALAVHESLKRREGPVQQELEVADLALGALP